MLADLTGGRLPHLNVSQLGAMRRRYWTFQIEQHVHSEAPRSIAGRQRRSARTGADTIRGDSYRLREKRRTGLLKAPVIAPSMPVPA